MVSAGYGAAREGAGLFVRDDASFLTLTGAAPGDMLKGILSGRIPGTLEVEPGGVGRGEFFYSAVLTPKGRMVTDLHVLPDHSGGYLLLLPEVGLEGAVAHFRKYINPRFALLQEQTEALAYLSFVGPGAGELLKRILDPSLEGLPDPGRVLVMPSGGESRMWVMGSEEMGLSSFHLIHPRKMAGELEDSAIRAGARPLSFQDWETLRIEAGRPRFGVDMTEETIPPEAGIQGEAIDYEKGCFTGHEVIIRLRDRGQVNKRLLRVLLGEADLPAGGTELYAEDSGKKVGWVTSSCVSPRMGQTIALGFIKRSVDVGSVVRLGGPQGSPGRLEGLT